jgi:hypothetical protein
MNRSKVFCYAFLILLSTSFFLFGSDIMPLSEVHEGMVGVGRTVFKGDHIEEFQVEILGVLQNYLPQQNLIIGMLKGSNLEETGVIAGMSGSPVFIDGRMIGAVAYSWPFAKTPIAGITPIESMLQTQLMPTDQPPVAPPIEVSEYYNFEKLLTNHFKSLPQVPASVPGLGTIQLSPISSSLIVSGFDKRIIDRFSSLFSNMGMQLVQGGSAGSTQNGLSGNDLAPGSPISVQLITGDFDIGAIGTVTYRDADKILAFGHPFFNLGPIDFPMATASIYTVVPSLFSSFKVGASGPVVGSIKQDLQAAVFGVVGSKSPMIPITLNMHSPGQPDRSFHFGVAKHNLLSPILLDFAFQNSVLVTQLGYSESTLQISGTIQLKKETPVQIKNIFSGAGSFANASQYVASILYALMINDFKKVEIEGLIINVDTTMQRKEAELMEVWLDKNEVRPGDQLRLRALYRPLLGEVRSEEFTMRIPTDLNLNQINFIVGSGQDLSRTEFLQYGKAYQPTSLDQLISILNGLRSNDRIYVKAFSNDPTLIMKGEFLYFLPSSIYSVLSSSQTIGSSQRVNRVGLWEDSQPIDYNLSGTKYFSLKVLPKQN